MDSQNNKYFFNKNLYNNDSFLIQDISRHENIKNNNISQRITRVNIDSRYRNIESKNIIKDQIVYLNENPLTFQKDSNIIRVNMSNHNFIIEDKIILQGISEKYISLTKGLTFYKDNYYVRINHTNHNLNNSQTTYKIRINNVIGNINDQRILMNIPINDINKIHTIYFTSKEGEIPSNNYYYIKIATSSVQDYEYTLSQIQIYFLQMAGIPINELNANFPINTNQSNGYHIIYNIIDNDNFEIQTTSKATISEVNGGKNIWIGKVNDFIEGYPDNNYYKISLKKTFYNVMQIKLISTEFPNTEKVIKNYPLQKKNNMLYWQILEDGNDIYHIEITPGNYSVNSLVNELTTKISSITRQNMVLLNKNNTDTNYIYYEYNLPQVEIIPQNDIFSLQFLQRITISRPLTLSSNTYEDNFDRLRVYHPQHNLNVNDKVIISNATTTNNIPDYIINTTHYIERILDRNTYEIKLPRYNKTLLVNDITNGGDVVVITYPIKFRLLFDRPYTLGNILGFRDVGKPNAITQYDTLITNNSLYEYDFDSEILNIKPLNNSINLSGDNYIFMSCPLFKEAAYTSGNIDGIFAKILLTGEPGTVMFNQFVQCGEYFKIPINTLSEFEVAFYDPLGELFYFNNMEHSYTLEIYENI